MIYPVEPSGFARCYVIAGPRGFMVVDPGSRGAARAVVRLIRRELGAPLTAVRYLAATHFHIDHIGGMGPLLAACGPDTRLLFSPPVRDYLTGRRRLNRLEGWFTALPPVVLAAAQGLRRPEDALPATLAGIPLPLLRRGSASSFPVERCDFPEAGKGPPGFEDWDILATPGHTEDSISFYHRETAALICGDLMLHMRRDGRGALNAFCWDRRVILDTLAGLRRAIAPRTVYPGHGEPWSGASRAGGGGALDNVETF
ncbi:MAG: MBL fold metallo-hydrolase [Pseudomonadota bacterium]|nr:MBL fold metallo-hydrolase [Pseudomonadota bacterium]